MTSKNKPQFIIDSLTKPPKTIKEIEADQEFIKKSRMFERDASGRIKVALRDK